MGDIREHVNDYYDREEVAAHIEKIVNKETKAQKFGTAARAQRRFLQRRSLLHAWSSAVVLHVNFCDCPNSRLDGSSFGRVNHFRQNYSSRLLSSAKLLSTRK